MDHLGLAPGARGTAMVGDTDDRFPRNFPLGRYVALYDGQGKVGIQCRRCVEVSRAPGRLVVDVVDSSYIWITIEAVSAVNHLRNLRVVPIELEATHLRQPFHPRFLEGLRAFGAVRFMGPGKVNGNPQERWADRTPPTRIFQDTDAGVALEYLIDLANAAGVDPGSACRRARTTTTSGRWRG